MQGNLAHTTLTVVRKRLMNFLFCVHHERSVARDRFIQRRSSDDQYFERCLCVWRVFDSYFVAIGSEHHHLSVRATLALCSEQSCSVNNVSEGIIVMRHLLHHHASRLEPVMHVDNRRP